MKKLMITAAAAMLGIAANASAITWGVNDALSDGAFKGGTAYLIFNGTSSTIPTFNNETYLKTHTAYAIADVLTALGGGTDTGLMATVGEDGKFSSTEPWGATTGSNKRFFAIVIDDEGKNMTISTATKKANIVASETSPATLTWAGSGEFSSTYKAEAVPEPTSAMLLLIGIGAMALRRRRA